MDSIVYKIDLDCRRSESQAKIEAKSGEASGRKIIFSLYEGRSPYVVPSGVTAVFRAKKPSGAVLFNNCTITDDGNIEYVITTQTVAEVGIMPCELQLIQGGKVIFSPCFTMVVVNNLAIDSEVESSDEFTELVEALEEVKTLGEAVHTVNGKTPDDDGDVTLDTDDIYLSPESEHYAATDTVTEVLDGITTELIKKADTEYVDDAVNGKVSKSGDTMTGALDMDFNQLRFGSTTGMSETNLNLIEFAYDEQDSDGVVLRNVAAPFRDTDAANKKYVDDVGFEIIDWVGDEVGAELNRIKTNVTDLDDRVTELKEDLALKADKDEIPTVPQNVSAFNNDSGYLTQHQSLAGYATEQWVEDKGYGTYSKPSNGIPKTDLAALVQASLDRADTALQYIPNTYRLAVQQDAIDATKQDIITDLAAIRSGAALGATALQSVPNTYRTASAQDVIDSGKQDKLIAGTNITIAADGKTISATGGGGEPFVVNITVNSGGAFSADKTNAEIYAAVQANKVVYAVVGGNRMQIVSATSAKAVFADTMKTNKVKNGTITIDNNAVTATETILQSESITDVGNYYATDTVEGALQEIGSTLNGLEDAINTIRGVS